LGISLKSRGRLKAKGKRMVRSSPVRNLTVTIDGVTYEGTYCTHDTMVYVQHGTGRAQTPIGESPEESIAQMLLSELVDDDFGLKAKGE
jgi:hypothetical protein